MTRIASLLEQSIYCRLCYIERMATRKSSQKIWRFQETPCLEKSMIGRCHI